MRGEGYYWVKHNDEWQIAYFRIPKDVPSGAWTLTAFIDDSWWFYDSDFDEIDENRITRTEKKETYLDKANREHEEDLKAGLDKTAPIKLPTYRESIDKSCRDDGGPAFNYP